MQKFLLTVSDPGLILHIYNKFLSNREAATVSVLILNIILNLDLICDNDIKSKYKTKDYSMLRLIF